jgi:hypothetical protein
VRGTAGHERHDQAYNEIRESQSGQPGPEGPEGSRDGRVMPDDSLARVCQPAGVTRCGHRIMPLRLRGATLPMRAHGESLGTPPPFGFPARYKFTLSDEKRLRPPDKPVDCTMSRCASKGQVGRFRADSSAEFGTALIVQPERLPPIRATYCAALRDRDMKRWESESEIQAQLRRLAEDARRLREEIRGSLRAAQPASRGWADDTPASAYDAVRLRRSGA